MSVSASRPTKPTASPAHIRAFGTSRLLGRSAPLFRPDPEDGEGGSRTNDERLSRREWEERRKAELADKGIAELTAKVAELEYDNRSLRGRLPTADQVVISKEEAAALESYRDQFPTPKDAKDASKTLGELRQKDVLRSYDEARDAAFREYGADLPDGFKALVPTAGQLSERPGGQEALLNLDLLAAQIEQVATAYGAEKQDKTEKTDVGISPSSVTSPRDESVASDAAQLARDFVARRKGQQE